MTNLARGAGGVSGAGRLLVAGLVAMALGACSTVSQSGLLTSSTPVHERLGTGGSVIGVLSFAEPGNLAGGSADGSYQAARLAASTIANSPVTIEIRKGGESSAQTAGRQLADAGARVAIVPADLRSANQAASALSKRGIASISLARSADASKNLYGAGFDPAQETEALADEVAKRGIAKVALVTTPGIPSQLWAAAAAKALKGKGLAMQVVDASDFDKAQNALAGMPGIGGVVFATSPEEAAGLAQVLRTNPERANLAFFSSAEWALAVPVPPALKGTIHAAPQGNTLKEYVRRFAAASGLRPTLSSALVYDLVILSAALRQAVPDAPYDRATLTGPDGFVGFTGAFSFAETGVVKPRHYSIYIAE